jgi:tetratricopeptide (TPR) repeat protein
LYHSGRSTRALLDDAIIKANRALELDSGSLVARRVLIAIYHTTGQEAEGVKHAKFMLDAAPDDYDTWRGAADAYFRVGMLERAIPLYQQALKADPANAGIRLSLARCYDGSGAYQQGLDVLAPLLKREQGSVWVAASLYNNLGQYEKAIAEARRQLAGNPKSWLVWIMLLRALRQEGQSRQLQEAGSEVTRLLETQLAAVENNRSRIWLGRCYALSGQRVKAQEQIQRALTVHPDDPWTLFQAGQICVEAGDRRAAVNYIKDAAAHGFVSIHYLREVESELRDDPEFQAVYVMIHQKVEELRKLY